jgi:hypothetical protein
MNVSPTFRTVAAAALLAISLGSAQAASISFSSAALPSQMTDWSSFADLQQFNPAQGVLQQVTLELFADLSGSAKAESRNNNPATITLNLQATLALARPGDAGPALVQTTPLVSHVFHAAARDNVIDYAGPSGITLNNLAASTSATASFTDGATLALFTGQGTLLLPFTALGQSYATGPGNVRYGFSTFAGGRATVTYDYLPAAAPVPEPASWALLLSGIAMVGWMASRRRA